MGSSNLDWRSFVHNYELNAVILGPEFGAQMEATFNQDLAAFHQNRDHDMEPTLGGISIPGIWGAVLGILAMIPKRSEALLV